MRTIFKGTIVLSFIGICVFGLVTRSSARSQPLSEDTSRSESAKDIYLQNCARCHGVDGHGQTEQGRKYDVPDLPKEIRDASTSKITRIITNGKQDMPSFGKKLTKKQISSLSAYVKKL